VPCNGRRHTQSDEYSDACRDNADEYSDQYAVRDSDGNAYSLPIHYLLTAYALPTH
jgi:hypothetical protein